MSTSIRKLLKYRRLAQYMDFMQLVHTPKKMVQFTIFFLLYGVPLYL